MLISTTLERHRNMKCLSLELFAGVRASEFAPTPFNLSFGTPEDLYLMQMKALKKHFVPESGKKCHYSIVDLNLLQRFGCTIKII